MGQLKLKYGSSEHVWQEGDAINPASSSGMLSMTAADNVVINLRQFDSQSGAGEARETLIGLIEEGIITADGNGDVIVTIDDL